MNDPSSTNIEHLHPYRKIFAVWSKLGKTGVKNFSKSCFGYLQLWSEKCTFSTRSQLITHFFSVPVTPIEKVGTTLKIFTKPTNLISVKCCGFLDRINRYRYSFKFNAIYCTYIPVLRIRIISLDLDPYHIPGSGSVSKVGLDTDSTKTNENFIGIV